ncbi:16S rRNA (guanine(966)-N(2))-methyltransferase RsmD [Lysobacter sp. A6]|uniref:Ribosomal RNA small subunit methyltransferase D n=1 Tax=Noviluteimonas lactosilytica TaxID=2888523 RepID=A0ABS8JM39_9GAMM|nr:16S rRNA (guanine(966)-N(2))-methyltransferase RsmD [Lysobacter lactosilyticus]MCC8364513.1 16S rRNA (guanine(966)-N(2))-methyltransferase RsmD [Lysobacter lactosilyticus]
MVPPASRPPGHVRTGHVRIVGGRWRGTKLPVPDRPGLRPTSDRVRETLFNWLAPMLPGARVLDLFAGTGALGFEALSRGAASAVLVEHDREAATHLRNVCARLQGGDAAQVVQADALAWLHAQPEASFDLAFVDPPFDANLWGGVLPALVPRMREGAWLYIEAPATDDAPPPEGWRLHREGRTRDVRYALYRRAGAGSSAGGDDTVTLAPISDPNSATE